MSIRREVKESGENIWEKLKKLNDEGFRIKSVINSLKKQIFIYLMISITCVFIWIFKKPSSTFLSATLIIIASISALFIYMMIKKLAYEKSKLSSILENLTNEESILLQPNFFLFNNVSNYFENTNRLLSKGNYIKMVVEEERRMRE